MISYSLPSNSSNDSETDNEYMSVKDAAKFSGYNDQYLRRLLVDGTIQGSKIGQVWLVNLKSLKAYLQSVSQKSNDRRYGPRVYHEYIEDQSGNPKASE